MVSTATPDPLGLPAHLMTLELLPRTHCDARSNRCSETFAPSPSGQLGNQETPLAAQQPGNIQEAKLKLGRPSLN